MNVRRYFLTVLAFVAAFALAAPLAYVSIAYVISAGLLQLYPEWILLVVLGIACLIAILVPISFAVREWRKNANV
jgi:hypothetical protein